MSMQSDLLDEFVRFLWEQGAVSNSKDNGAPVELVDQFMAKRRTQANAVYAEGNKL